MWRDRIEQKKVEIHEIKVQHVDVPVPFIVQEAVKCVEQMPIVN